MSIVSPRASGVTMVAQQDPGVGVNVVPGRVGGVVMVGGLFIVGVTVIAVIVAGVPGVFGLLVGGIVGGIVGVVGVVGVVTVVVVVVVSGGQPNLAFKQSS